MNKQSLLELGLSEREISVYVSLLKIGETTTGAIVKRSGVPNAKIYEILEKLMDKGLVSYVFKGKIKHFHATKPKVLLNILENKKSILKEVVKELERASERGVPEYKSTIYEGLKAIKSVFFEMYDYIGENGEYCVFPIGTELEKTELRQFFAEVFHKRYSMKIKIRTLPNKNLKNILKEHYSHIKAIKIRYTNNKFPTGIFIFKDHILNVIWDEKPVAFLIKSKQNYEKWMGFFEEQWEIAKK